MGKPRLSCTYLQEYFDVSGCRMNERNDFAQKKIVEEAHKNDIQKLKKNRKMEITKHNCHLYNGRGVKGCPDKLLNKFTHITPCWKVSECLASCLTTYKNSNEIECYDSCLCRAGITPPCHPPTCMNTLNLDVAKFPSDYVTKLRKHIKK